MYCSPDSSKFLGHPVVLAFPLSGISNYVVEEFSAERQRAIISWETYLNTKGEAGSADSLPILHRTHSDPIPRLETVQSHRRRKLMF